MAVDPTPARVNAGAARCSASYDGRDAFTPDDQSSTIAGLPLSDVSGAGNGSYIHVVRGADAGARPAD